MSGTEIDIAWIREIAKKTRGEIAADAETSTQKFRDTTVTPSHVGTLDVSHEYAAQANAAHAFFVETIQGVLDDLDAFATNLDASADAHETNDDNTAAGMNNVNVTDAADAALNDVDDTYEGDHDYESDAENQESAGNPDLVPTQDSEAADGPDAAPADTGSGGSAGGGQDGFGGSQP